jgi:hypothetical protein
VTPRGFSGGGWLHGYGGGSYAVYGNACKDFADFAENDGLTLIGTKK